jgi:putative cardiolipin synthase
MRPIELALRFRRLHRRMHNKIFVVDGVTGIFGGRNIGDTYFDESKTSNFADFDVFVAGQLIGEACTSFEQYWNHPLAVPVESLTSAEVSATALAAGRRDLARRLEKRDGFEERYDRARAGLVEFVEDPDERLTWARAEFVADSPDKLDPDRPTSSPVLDRLVALWDEARREVLIESGYFVPRRRGTRFIIEQARQGVRTRLLTNSLAANDVTPVHVGYAKYRRRLLKAGVELYEFQRGAAPIARRRRSDASLHAKVAVFDRKVTWVGSFNLDPRSAELNTELAIVIHSEELSRRAAGLIERDLAPDRSWRLRLERRRTGGREMVWYGHRDGKQVREHSEPDATLWQRAVVNTVKWIPGVEGLL